MNSTTPRKVLLCTSVFPRWKDDNTPPFVLNLAEAIQASRQWEVTLLAPHHSGAEKEEMWNGMQIIRFSYCWPASLQKLCYEGGMLVQLKKNKWLKLLLPLFFLTQLFALWNVTRKHSFDLLHSHSLLPQGLTTALIARWRKLPHLTTSHGNDVFGLSQTGLYSKLKKWVIRNSDAITANSHATASALQELGGKPEKIKLIPAMPSIFPPQEELTASLRQQYQCDQKFTLIFVGRLIEEKGLGDLIEAIALLKETLPQLQLIVLGEGADKDSFQKQCQDAGIVQNVHFLGWVPRETVSSYLKAADVFIAPSRAIPGGWQEAQGLTIVEAMASGKAIIATETGGIIDMIKHEKTGLLVKTNAPREIADCIQRLGQNEKLKTTLAEAAKIKFETQFAPQCVTAETLKQYSKLSASA